MSSRHSHKDSIECPDPSVHTQYSKDHELQNNASKAALLAAGGKKPSGGNSQKEEYDVLGPDGKLSSAGAAASLRYAKPQDLPAFPTVGIEPTKSGHTAASLAFDNPKSVEWWKPEEVKMSSAAGKAALLAAGNGGNVELWKYKPDGTGNSAASIAMRNPQNVQSIGTLSGGYPDADKAKANALQAATTVHRNNTLSRQSASLAEASRPSERAMEAARVQHTVNVPASQYGATPTTAAREDEATHQAALRASAISMAQALYTIEKPVMERIAAGEGPGDSAARRAHADHSAAQQQAGVSGGDALKMQAMNYAKVQEMAQRLANERLAKLDPDGIQAYREHYGYGREAATSSQSGNKVRASRRGRAGSNRDAADGEELDSDEDEARAARIKSQQRGLEQKVAAIDEEKRTADRKSLLAAAQRSVQARMSALDEQVFKSTGKASPAMMAQWEAQAQAKAAANSEERMLTHGKVHIGGGRYMDQSEVDAIAAARMQPTLDEISATAEAQRVRDAEIRVDKERREEAARVEKQRQAEAKAYEKRVKSDQKDAARQAKEAEKLQARQAKEADKAAKEAEKARLEAARRQEKLDKAAIASASSETERLHREHLSLQERAEREREAEAAAAERERLADEQIAAAEREVEAAGPSADVSEAASIATTAPEEPVAQEAAVDRPTTETERVTSGETERSSFEMVDNPTASTPTKRESKLKGLFSRITRPSKADAPLESGEKFKSGTGEAGASAELTDRVHAAEADEPALAETEPDYESVDPAAAVGAGTDATADDADDTETIRGRDRFSTISTSTTTEHWDDARDRQSSELSVPVAPAAHSPARSGSKFQEDL